MSFAAGEQRRKRKTFGATAPPFIDYLKDILRRYPDGGQILKELIQNADDAGATEVVFIHDERSYEKQTLCTSGLEPYQGAALYTFNDAVFTDEDWRGIQTTGRSVKRNDPNKVGRFGIGFNSVYHITDLPSVFSGKYLGMLDPQEKVFEESPGGSIWCLNDEQERGELLHFQEQFQPFKDVLRQVSKSEWDEIVGTQQYFSGTLFRFPLRREPSEISDNLYDAAKMAELFESFIYDADISLLFLRSVSSVSVVHVNSHGTERLRLKVTSSCSKDVSISRQELELNRRTAVKNIECWSQSKGDTAGQWLVTTGCRGEGQVPQLDSLGAKLSYIPQVDIAFPMNQDQTIDGRLVCFLPLPNNEPNKTGLPVHINACFGLTDNRRHIKWQEEDQKNDEAAIWNECLVKEVLPFVYNAIILDAINLSQNGLFPASKVYQLWPDLQQMQHKDRWHSVSVEMLQHLLKLKESVLYLASNEKNWVGPLKAVFMPSELEDPDIKDAVAKVLISAEENLVHVPNHVIKDIQCAYGGSTTLKWVTPAVVRDILRKRGTSHLHKNVKLLLLEYLLSDGKCHELWGLELLPLSNGTFVSFTKDDVALIDNTQFPRELLPTCKDRFLLKGLKGEIVASLKQLAGTGKYKQIICLDASQVARLTRANLPKDWQKSSSVVSWHIGNSDHPPKEWLQQFWTYLNSHFRNLERFIDIPLIPLSPLTGASKTVTLARLQQKTTLVSQNSKENGLSNGLIKVVTSVGGILVQRDELTEHPDLETYLLNPSPSNILKLFLNLEYAKVESGIKAVSAHDKKELKSFLCMLDFLSNPEKNIVLQLPLFKPMTCLTFQGENIAAKSKQALALNSDPYIPADIPVPDAIVQCETEVDTKLLKLLKIELINSAQVAILLVDGVKRKLYQTEDENKIMSWILQHGSTLFSQNLSLWKVCKDLKFIRSTKGEYKKASSVFDPRNKCFEVLFGPDMFPPAAFSTTQMLDSLKQLGMRSAEQEITADNLLQVTTQIDKFHVQSPEEYFAKANEVIKLLNDTNVLSKFTPQQCSQLVNMHWLPCERPGSLNGKPTTCVYKPVDVRHSQFNYIVGQVMPLTKELNERVSKKLGLFNRLPTEKVLENLAAMNVETAAMDNPDTNIVFKEKLHNTYRFMQENIASFKDVLNKKKIKWIWIDNHFASPHDVVLEHPPELDLSSYIKKVPKEFLAYKQLLSYSGVRKALSHEEVYEILDRMKESIDDRRPPHGTQKELEVAKAILTWIWKERKTVNENFPVPVMEEQNFTLKPLSSTVFCDIAKAGLEDLSEDEQFHVIHEEIPRAVAEWLKVPFLSTRILNPEFIGIEQCGQVEPLTVRINNILKEYDEDNDLFKELIQNAEDAGASTCKFMLDFRKHKEPPESLIDPGMSVCQGPCLWAYNNGVFTEDDWVNITRVGAASKEKQIEKIGKFGLGFNSVYHVTDIPSVLSGKSLLILDPNVTHLKKHIQSKANPGIKLNLFQKRLFQKFPGEFKPYDGVFECNLTKSIGNDKFYKGSLFKLPFRTEKEAQTSEISKKVYGEHRICSLQENLTANSQHLLLFLKNVCSVSLEILSEKASMPPLEREKEIVLNVTKSVMGTWQIPDSITKWLKTQDKSLPLLRNEELASKVIDTLVANIVKLTSEQGSQCVTQYWLSYSCIGRNQSLHIVQKTGKDTFSLPIGSIAVPLEKDPSGKYWVVDSIRQDGQVFCFLPLSIKSGLPVQINGSFSVTSNRKGIWETGEKSQWNQALLQDAVLTAYITILLLLKSMSAKGELKNYLYCTFWPDKEKVSTPFQPLVMAFYSAVAQTFSGQDIELFGNGQTWCSIKKARFLHPNIHLDKKVGEIATSEFLSIHNKSFVPVPLPEWLRKSFTGTGFHKIIEERTCDWFAFYKEVVFSRLSNIDTGSRNALLLHAIDMNDGDIDDLLKTSPCIPTQGKQLQFISKLVHAQGKVACLYETEKNRFLEGTLSSLLSPKQIKRLSELGMITDHLSLAEIKERAEKISIVWKQDKRKALSHIQHILDLARDCLHDSNSTHWEALKNIKFIPSHLPKPVNKSETVTLNRPVDVYSFNCRYLVNMTKPTVTSGHYSEQVMSKLGVRQNPALPVVHMQLEKAYLHASEYEEDLISNIAEECYEYLDKKEMDKAQLKAICAWANSFPFVLISGTFVHKRYVAKMLKFDARPYLYELPGQLVRFKNLWKSVGIKKHFTSQQFMHVLQEMKNKYRQTELCQDDFALCLSVINVGLFKEESCVEDGCLIPDTKKVLRPASQLNFNDTPWMPVSDGQLLCHELISRPVARYFGINTTRHHTLQNHEEKHFLPFAKEFGQSEKLTVRISNIIAAYPSKKDILKELIQNADDAQATEIHFIWDNRSHSTEKTFGEKWNSLQGPALCVYNNRVFTPADMEGIQKLGEGGKHDLKGKTGKYGLGFNSVYHLTDCPTILTGDKFLCVFDPNMRYLDCASKQSPGCMYKLDSKFKDTFKDVYNTFLPNHFILDVGTMFRLPIRTSEMAELSEISKFPVTDNDIKELLSTLSDDPDGLIIFLKHIAKIQFHEINVDTTEIETKFSVEIKLDKKNHKKKKSFQNHVQQLLSSVEPVKPCQVFYKMEVLASHIGSTVISQKPKQWIMAEQFGSKHSTDDVESDHTGNTVPQAAVAVLNGSTEAFTGRAFCSLPLPDNTGLPVHVNGNFELDSSRRDMWKQDGESVKAKWNESLLLKVIAPLYVNILHFLCINQSVPRFDLKFLSAHLDVSYLCFFPHVTEKVDKKWHPMINELYRLIDKERVPIIPILRIAPLEHSHHSNVKYTICWSSITNAVAADAPHFTVDNTEPFTAILLDIGMNLVPQSWQIDKIARSFQTAGTAVRTVNPGTVSYFLQNNPLNDPTQTKNNLPLPISQTLIRDKTKCKTLLDFCMKDIDENYASLDGLPLLLTNDKMLRRFNTASTTFLSSYANLFQGYEECFADFINREHKEVLEKGNFIQKLTISNSARYLKPILNLLLNNCQVDPSKGLHVPEKQLNQWLELLWKFLPSHILYNVNSIYQTKTKAEAQSQIDNFWSDIEDQFFDSPIVPVKSQDNKCFLQTVGALSSVILTVNSDVSGILMKLGVLKLDRTFFLKEDILNQKLLNCEDRSAVLKQLCVMESCKSQFDLLSGDELDGLLEFLLTGYNTSQKPEEYQRKLYSLPLFETLQQGRQRINQCREVFLLNTSLNIKFPDFFIGKDESIFLNYSPVNHKLSSLMNIPILNDLEYYIKFILPFLKKCNKTQVLNSIQILMEIQNDANYQKYHSDVVSTLKNIPFVLDINDKLQTASYFYDKSVKLYDVMLPPEVFVPDNFWKLVPADTYKRLYLENLLKACGLKHIVSDEEIMEFAHQIESDAKGDCSIEILQKRSKEVFENLLEKNEQEVKQSFLMKMSSIKFVFPEKVEQKLCKYHQPYASDREVVQIKGSLIKCEKLQERLIWTSMPILPYKWQSEEKTNLLKTAGAVQQPSPADIIENLKNVCKTTYKTPEMIKTRSEILCHSYAVLQIMEFDPVHLDFPLVLVENETVLVKINQTVMVLQEDQEFRPYLYQIPSKLALCREFFKRAGVEETPSAKQYFAVLQEVYKDTTGKETLQPNQVATVRRTVQQLFQLFEKKPLQSPSEHHTLYLPATDGKLYESSSLYFNDTYFSVSRWESSFKEKLLEKLKLCYLGDDIYKHLQMLNLLPDEIRPKMLSEVMSEALVESHIQLCRYSTNCEFTGLFQRHLSSEAFLHGLICLIRHKCHGIVSDCDAENMCRDIFEKINFICCQTLETVILLDEEPLSTSIMETQVYVKAESQGCTFYLKHSDDLHTKIVIEVNASLIKEINALLKNILTSDSLLILGQLLVCDNMEDVQKLLEKNGILNSLNENKGHVGIPEAGSVIPDEWIDTLDMNFLNNFEEGEYVGFRNSSSDEMYCYAIVVEKLGTPSHQFCQKYKIQIGEDEYIEASNLDLYQFKRGPEKCVKRETFQTTSSQNWDLVCSQPQTESVPPTENIFPKSLEEIKKEIDNCLKEIWALPKDERHKLINRLYLRWHPDKNTDNEILANEAFKYLKQKLEELEQNKTGHDRNRNGSSQSDWSWHFRDFFRQWNHDASRHRRGRERFYQRYSSRQYNFWTFHGSERPRPNVAEARRWHRQATCDLSAAQNDRGRGATEWCLFKVHQAVEKALIGAEYRRTGKKLTNLNISSLALKVSQYSPKLRNAATLVQQLQTLGVDAKATQYPNYHPFPHIPNEQFSSGNEAQILSIAEELLLNTGKYINEGYDAGW